MRELGIIIGGALLARDGVIVAVGAASEPTRKPARTRRASTLANRL